MVDAENGTGERRAAWRGDRGATADGNRTTSVGWGCCVRSRRGRDDVRTRGRLCSNNTARVAMRMRIAEVCNGIRFTALYDTF